ncbi:MAG TPA: hypothetical protein VFG87_23870 [Amycolatopsis sp.]|jgi:hypothetical protein|nr:hypothetical protein [Amycolatopsis sp.]
MRETTEYLSEYAAERDFRYSGGDVSKVPETAEDHRAMAIDLLDRAGHGDTQNRIAAAQVHAILALTAPEADGFRGGER